MHPPVTTLLFRSMSLFLAVWLLMACQPTAASLPPPSPTRTNTPPPPLATLTATAAPTPTSTATAMPTHTPVPSPTATTPPTTIPTATATPISYPLVSVLGLSYERRALVAYQWGNGPQHIVLVGGIHGGYEWNTVLLGYQMVDYFTASPQLIPAHLTLTIIPNANPDGMFWLLGREGRFGAADITTSTEGAFPGRFNGRNVDLNRNWDCNWERTAVWQTTAVNPGTAPFSEPETIALRDFFVAAQPILVLFWHSAAEAVFPAGCGRIDSASAEWANIYSNASGYPVYNGFSAYPITGDASNWLTTQGISSITVELITHDDPEWAQNVAGVMAVINQ